MADQPPKPGESRPGETEPLDPQETAYRALHAERGSLERALTLAQQQQRFGADAEGIDSARLREESLLKDLDRVMTMIRAAEIRRRPGPAARRWQ